MKKALHKYLNVIYLFLITGVLFLILLFIFFNRAAVINHWFTSLSTLIGIIGTILTAKDISQRFKAFLVKSKVILFNKQMAWSLEAEFLSNSINLSTFSQIKSHLKQIGDNRTVFGETDYKISINIDGVTFQLKYQEMDNEDVFVSNDSSGKINFYLPEYHAPYIDSNFLLETRITPLLNEIKKKIGQAEENFRFQVFFKDDNPFLGFYIKDSNNKNISFMCSYYEEATIPGIEEKNHVVISQNSMNLDSSNLYSLIRLINKHLFLAGGN
ncbi:hypothetical protein ACDX66_07235 [Peribacillus frigoritolerans]